MNSNRRQFLRGVLATVAGAATTVVLASTTAEATTTPTTAPQPEKPEDIQKRADQLANAAGTDEEEVPVRFVNRAAFRNGYGGGGFRNGGFANGFGGGFRNGGFANGFGGGFRNGAFRNW